MTRSRGLVVAVVIVVIALAGGVAYDSINLFSLSSRALALATAQRADREQTILRACRDQNHRHRVTVRDLDRLYRPVERRVHTAAQRRQLRASRRSTLLLIGALAPLQNCQQQLFLDQSH